MILAWLLMAIGESVGLRWIIWDEAKAVPPEVFDEMMVIIARMLGGQTSGTYNDGTRSHLQVMTSPDARHHRDRRGLGR